MIESVIARELNCNRAHVNLVLKGKRNPYTDLSGEIINRAANIHAEKCKNDFIQNVFKTYKLHKSIDKMKADLIEECKKHQENGLHKVF